MTVKYDLFIDESGNFSENTVSRHHQDFDNQLVGILAPANKLQNSDARRILQLGYQQAGYSCLPDTVHGTRLQSGDRYDRLIDSLVGQIKYYKIQPVRLKNAERINYGDPSSNYVNMLAELALRIYYHEFSQKNTKITINFYCALVAIGGKRKIQIDEYRRSLKNYMAFAAVRLGWATEYRNWKIDRLELLDANHDRRIQICDLLSNASHREARCGEQVANKLEAAFNPYNQTLIVHPFFEKLDILNEQCSYGTAIQAMAEQIIKVQNNEDEAATLTKIYDRLKGSIDTLANLPVKNRDIHLNILVGWLEQIIAQERSLELGDAVISWLKENVNLPLEKKLDGQESLSWFTYSLHSWRLAICNHRGNLYDARAEIEVMEKLLPNLAQQWEQIPLMMGGLIRQAVHYTDSWEYYKASKSMLSVFKYYHDISSLFIDALPEVFPEQVSSQMEAKALGTWLQSEIFASIFLPSRMNLARNISDVCIHKFPNPQDKNRQYQYRAQLETSAGEYQAARKFLAMSIDAKDYSHKAIAESISALNNVARGFALLHWLRLGTSAYLSNNHNEWSKFSRVLQNSKLLNTSWCQGNEFAKHEYPTLGILRRVALINAVLNRPNPALGRLRNLNPTAQKNIVFGAIQIAAYSEVAALQWETKLSEAKLLIDCSQKEKLGLRQLVDILAQKSKDTFPRFWMLTQLWSKSLEDILHQQISKNEVRQKLLEIANSVNY